MFIWFAPSIFVLGIPEAILLNILATDRTMSLNHGRVNYLLAQKAGSRKMTLKSGIRAVLANTTLIPLLTLIPVFRKFGFFRR